MPKTKPPKYCRDKGKNKAFVIIDGKKNYLPGKIDSAESREAYARFELEWWENSRRPVAERIAPSLIGGGVKDGITVSEVALAFLQWAESTKGRENFIHYRTATMQYLVKHYGSLPADEFTAGCLNLTRQAMIQARRKDGRQLLCRNQINSYTRRIVTLFSWGVSTGLVNRMTAWELSFVKPLEYGHPGTIDHPPKEYVKDDVIIATLPLLPPTLQAMIKLQRLTGMRPIEVYSMRVGNIDKTSVPGIWLYRLASHKTQRKTGKERVISLNEAEQALIAPYLEGKKPTAAVFSPRTAMEERKAERRAHRKTKMTPSALAKEAARKAKPPHYSEFYNKDSYRVAVCRAIEKHNRQLPVEQQIPHWTPYGLRHSAVSAISVELGGDKATLLCGHTKEATTAIYKHREIEKMTKLAVERMQHNPFTGEQTCVAPGGGVTLTAAS